MRTENPEPLGAAVVGDNRCRFLVWAPRANDVEVSISSPPSRRVPMEPVGCGYFRTVIEGVTAGTLYRYRLDHANERPDPASRYQPQGVHGPSQVIDNRFGWTDSSWIGPPLEEYVLYEVHVGTFSPQGTFDAIIPRLPQLRDLGITAIELMPLAQFPGDRNWGYDGVYPYAVQASYGGPAALKNLVNACHLHGMAVALDVVYNHLGPEGNYLTEFGPYFTDLYKTPWGEAINYEEAESDHVRRYFIENALFWVTDYHLDALRLDAVHAIRDASAQTFLEQLRQAVQERARELGRNIYLIAESHRNDAQLISAPEMGGAGYDGVWNDDFHHSLHVILTGERNGYYEDFRSVEDLAKCYREGFLYSGQYATFWRRRRGNSSRHIPAKRFVVYAQNHDQVGNRRDGDRLTQIVSFDRLKMAAGAVVLSANIPLLFMGEEYGEPAPFLYFVSHTDAQLVQAVRRGRREEFSRFSWQGEIADPQSEETFWRSKLNWSLQSGGQYRILRQFYHELLRLRRELPALAALDKDSMRVTSSNNTLLVDRWQGPSRAMVSFHFNDAPNEITLPAVAGRWEKVLDSVDWQPTGVQHPESSVLDSNDARQASLGPWSFSVFVERPALAR
jgi:maltooligosyltrehalose trehalohydrolase